MDLAFTFLLVTVGIGAIVYAGLRNPARKSQADSTGDTGAPLVVPGDGDSPGDGGGDGGGGD